MRAARQPKSNGGKAGAVEMKDGESIERTGFTAIRGGLAREGVCVRDKQIIDRVIIAAGALETDHAPNVLDFRAGLRDQHGAFGWLAVGTKTRRAIRFHDRAVTAEPARVLDAAGEAPTP